jgi:hypothetical protein
VDFSLSPDIKPQGWEDASDWELNRMSIPEPKVEHHEGRGIRSCPIFPECRSILDDAFEIFGECCGSLRGPQSWISEKSTTLTATCEPINQWLE